MVTGHVNNLYNTTFWNMVKGNPDTDTPAMTPTEAELALKVSPTSLCLLSFADLDGSGHILKRQARDSLPEVQNQLRQGR
jgi:hypothetical protein